MEHVFLFPDAKIWDPFLETYALNKYKIVDDHGREMVYPAPKKRELFEPAKISDVHAERIETIDDHNPQYNLIDARINAIISSSVVSLYDTLSPKQVFVTDPIDVG